MCANLLQLGAPRLQAELPSLQTELQIGPAVYKLLVCANLLQLGAPGLQTRQLSLQTVMLCRCVRSCVELSLQTDCVVCKLWLSLQTDSRAP